MARVCSQRLCRYGIVLAVCACLALTFFQLGRHFDDSRGHDGDRHHNGAPNERWIGGGPAAYTSTSLGTVHPTQDLMKFASAYFGNDPRFKTHLSTDKAIYRPGESVRLRAVYLHALTLAPMSPRSNHGVQLAIKGPKGETVFEQSSADMASSASGFTWPIPSSLAGGKYTAEITHQADGFPPAERSFSIRTFNNPKLKLQLKFAKDGYGPGDTVKAYLTATRAQGGIPVGAVVSFTARLDGTQVAAGTGSPVSLAGTSSISFALPDAIARGEGSLNVVVRDGGTMGSVGKTLPILLRSFDLQAYPEGGNFVAGLPARVYVTGRNTAGDPADFAADIVATSNPSVAVATVETQHEGRGVSTEFLPVAGEVYQLRVTRPASVEQSVELPEVLPQGGVITAPHSVYRPADPITVRVGATAPGGYRVVLYKREVEIAASAFQVPADASTSAHAVTFTPPSTSSADGVLRVTLYEAHSGKPLAERLLFRRPHSFQVSVATDKQVYAPGDTVQLTVTSTLGGGEGTTPVPMPSFVGITVTDDTVLQQVESRRQPPRLPAMALLEDEVRGDLTDAAAYLADLYSDTLPGEATQQGADATTATTPAAKLDLLLGTQGWRRFVYEDPELFLGKAPDSNNDNNNNNNNRWRPRPGMADASGGSNSDGGAPKRDLPQRSASEYAEAERLLGVHVQPQRFYHPMAFAERGGMPMMAGGAADGRVKVMALNHAMPMRAGAPPPMPAPMPGMAMPEDAAGAVATGAPAMAGDQAAVADFAMAEMAEEGAPAGAPPPQLPDMMDDEAAAAEEEEEEEDEDEMEELVPQMRAKMAADAPMAPRAQRKRKRHHPGMVEYQFGTATREYAHQLQRRSSGGGDEGGVRTRRDFTDTVLWVAGVELVQSQGCARTFSFVLSDAVTTYRIAVDGISTLGWLASTTDSLVSVTPLAVDVRLPAELTDGDRVRMPATATWADPDTAGETRLQATVEGPLHLESSQVNGYLVAPTPGKRSGRVYMDALAALTNAQRRSGGADEDGSGGSDASGTGAAVTDARDGFPVTVHVTATDRALTDHVVRGTRVMPRGFPHAAHSGGMLRDSSGSGDASTRFAFTLPADMAAGSVSLAAAVYPSPVGSITKALEALLRKPCGCFEQTSSTTYPLVMAQQYFQSHSGVDPDLIARSARLLKEGYDRLVGFESDGGGFEWFGGSPGHEALTAYGALQFQEMAQVMDVDADMLQRTRKWLLDRRDGSGGFKRNPRALDSFGRASEEITNAYIVWSLTSAGLHSELEAEVQALYARATDDSDKVSKDPYFVGLVAASLYNVGRKEEGYKLATRLRTWQQPDDGSVSDAAGTITCSGGRARDIETTSIAIITWLQDPDHFAADTHRAVEWLVSQCQDGGFGGTQATVLALKAIIAYDVALSKGRRAGKVTLVVDGTDVDTQDFTADTQGAVTFDTSRIVNTLHAGTKHVAELRLSLEAAQPSSKPRSTEFQLPYSIALEYRSKLPANPAQPSVTLDARLSNSVVTEGQATEMIVKVTNADAAKDLPMVVAQIGLPAGLEPRHAQLDELVAAGRVAFYELRGSREVALYWRGLPAGGSVELPLDLVAVMPGRFTGEASRVYPYYTEEDTFWVAGASVEVVAA